MTGFGGAGGAGSVSDTKRLHAQTPDAPVRFSDVAQFVGLALIRDPHLAQKHPKVFSGATSTSKASLTNKLLVRPVTGEQLTKDSFKGGRGGARPTSATQLKNKLELLRSEHRAESAQVQKLEAKLSGSMLQERQALKRAEKYREMRDAHMQHAERLSDSISKRREEIHGIMTDSGASQISTATGTEKDDIDDRDHDDTGFLTSDRKAAKESSHEPVLRSCCDGNPDVDKSDRRIADCMAGNSLCSTTTPCERGGMCRIDTMEGASLNKQGQAANLRPLVDKASDTDNRATDNPESGVANLNGGHKSQSDSDFENSVSLRKSASRASLAADAPRGQEALSATAIAGTGDACGSSDMCGMTLKEWFTGAQDEGKRKASTSSSTSSLNRGSLSKSAGSLHAVPHFRPGYLADDAEGVDDPDEKRRRAVRRELVMQAGGELEAFRRIDLNRSGHISLQEFADGVSRLGVRWQELTGLKRSRELFKLFDQDRDGVIDLAELFPQNRQANTEPQRVSTPEFCRNWRSGSRDFSLDRCPKWQNTCPDEELQVLFASLQSQQEAADKRRWMAATIRRLKNRGKSDARCREVVAPHLPRGSGPKDRDDVRAFSPVEVKACKRAYMDEVLEPVRNIEKVVYDMREQRRILQNSRQQLCTVTMEPFMRQKPEEERKQQAVAGGTGSHILGRRKQEEYDETLEQQFLCRSLAEIYGMDVEEVEQIQLLWPRYTGKAVQIKKKGFSKLLEALLPNAAFGEGDLQTWWDQYSELGTVDEEDGQRKPCSFEHFVAWYHDFVPEGAT